MSYTRLRPSFTLTEDRLAELRAVMPEVFADGKINWETLKDALAPELEEEGPGAEHFGLFWPGKREARRLAALPSRSALHPAQGEGIAEDTTRNVFIEGDNLEVLKLLLKSYTGRVKMIYIDPPYNTGNDVVYKDNYAEVLDNYLTRTGQVDEQSSPLTTNTKSSGRFHSIWLSMMYPRLRVARTLLEDGGVIFVSYNRHGDSDGVVRTQLSVRHDRGVERVPHSVGLDQAWTVSSGTDHVSRAQMRPNPGVQCSSRRCLSVRKEGFVCSRRLVFPRLPMSSSLALM